MNLRVDPWDLSGYARQIGRAAHDAADFKSHCTRYTRISASDQGLLSLFLTTHTSTVETVNRAMDRLQEVLKAASSELERNRKYYTQTDLAVAARVDATYPLVKRPVE
ncbi:hypothetical protein [Streptomyces sp. NPDC090083]|uniref:hypothetical protein n=1 Tax=Streptomyces sp. NPDC090083 TaxID=3365941 RepID=UPI0037F548FF